MPFTIRAALDSLVTLQESLAITDPITTSVKQAHKTFPKQDNLLPDTPCVINIPRLVRVTEIFQSRQQQWQVRMQLLVDDADRDRAADIVLALLQKLLDALSDAITLNGLPLMIEESTSDDLGAFDYGGKSFTGIELTTSLIVPLEAVTVGP